MANPRQEIFLALIRPVIITFLLAFSVTSYSQYLSSPGQKFSVDEIEGCAPFKVTITNTALKPGFDCGTSTCQMTFEPTVIVQNTFSYTYNTPGTYQLKVLYPSAVGNAVEQVTITVLPNIQPDFEIHTCSLNGITVKITDKNYDQYAVDFGDGNLTTVNAGPTQNTSHTYAASGTQNISIHGRKTGAKDNCDAKIRTFDAVAVLPAPFITTMTAIDINSFKLDFTTPANVAPNLELRLEIAVNNSTTFQNYGSFFGVNTITISNTGLNLSQNYYCFRLNVHDPCTGADTPSNVICSQKFTAVAQSDVDKLAWLTAGVITDYSIARDGSPYVSTPASSFDDVDIICTTHYCYQLTSNYTNGSKSISLSECVDAFSGKIPTSIENSSAVVTPGGVDLSWLQDPAFVVDRFILSRRANADAFQFIADSPVATYSDPVYTTAGNFCYRITYTDKCRNTSLPDGAVCPLRLLGTLDNRNFIHLMWNSYKGWKNGVKSYRLERFDDQGNVTRTVDAGTDTSYVDSQNDSLHQIVSYRVTAIPNDALVMSVSNIATFTKEANLWSPTAFTPDRNNKNDTFTVRGFFITRIELRIFNRWGTMIFSTDKNEPWDGTFDGKVQPNDTYVWTAGITDLAGQTFSRSGTVVLLTQNK